MADEGARILSWNISDDAFEAEPEEFLSLLQQADPDIVLLDEVQPSADVAKLQSALTNLRNGNDAAWNINFGSSGGRQRCVIASRAPQEIVPEFSSIVPYPEDARRYILEHMSDEERTYSDWSMEGGIPVNAVIIRTDGRRLLTVSTDLQCCGDDVGNWQEYRRRAEANEIRQRIQQVLERTQVDGVIIAGDFNVVHGPTPLELLSGAYSPPHDSLIPAELYHADGAATWTWDGRGTPFPSSTLDYQLYSPQSLEMHSGLILDASGETGRHRPLVVEYGWSSYLDLQPVLDQVRIDQDVPGVSTVVAREDEIIFAGASGVADLETGRRMTPDTILYAGSLTKIFTAVLILQLVEQNELSLHDVVYGIAGESSPPHEDILVSHLLTHASGLDREGNFGYWFTADFPDDAALASYLLGTKLRDQPGASVSYSNIGYAALGPVVARASGQSYDDALQTRVLNPLGMTASGTLQPGPELSSGYSPVNRVLPNEERPFAGLGRRVGKRHIREYHNAKAMTPAFGAFTSSRDLSQLARMLLGYGDAEVLSDDMRTRLLTAHAGIRGYGIRLGTHSGRPVARHGGWFAAHRTHLLLDLQSGISVVVMANSDSAAPEKIAEALLDSVLDDASR